MVFAFVLAIILALLKIPSALVDERLLAGTMRSQCRSMPQVQEATFSSAAIVSSFVHMHVLLGLAEPKYCIQKRAFQTCQAV